MHEIPLFQTPRAAKLRHPSALATGTGLLSRTAPLELVSASTDATSAEVVPLRTFARTALRSSENIWFTGDTHFGHTRMAEVWRDVGSLEEMDELMITRWNEVVKPHDRVYHLGDFSFYGAERTLAIRQKLHGQLHMIYGNHDRLLHSRSLSESFESFSAYKEIKVSGQRLVLFHFPIESWHQVGHGSWHLHGHCHGNMPEDLEMARMDVGVDTHDFYPWHFDEIAARLQGREGRPNDHHQDR